MVELPDMLALDPGGTTGWCATRHTGGDLIKQGHIGPHVHHEELWQFLCSIYMRRKTLEFHIVCESFEFRKTERHRDFINYIPREYIGVVNLFVQHHADPNVKLFMQSAMNVIGDRAFFTDDKIKKLGLWVPGRKHAMDATRHYLYHRVFTLKDKSLLQLLK